MSKIEMSQIKSKNITFFEMFNTDCAANDKGYKSQVFEKFGTKAAISDFAITRGGYTNNYSYIGRDSYVKNFSPQNRCGDYFVYLGKDKQSFNRDIAYRIDSWGESSSNPINCRVGGARPVLPYSLIKEHSRVINDFGDGILEVEFGEYPIKSASQDMQKLLCNFLSKSNLKEINETYTVDPKKYNDYSGIFEAITFSAYEYNGFRYINVEANPHNDFFTLSNGLSYKRGDYIWHQLQPIRWYVDIKKDIAISKIIVFSGVKYIDIEWFINYYFIKEIMQLYNREEKYVKVRKRLSPIV